MKKQRCLKDYLTALDNCTCSRCILNKEITSATIDFYKSAAGQKLAIDYLDSCVMTMQQKYQDARFNDIKSIAVSEYYNEKQRRENLNV